jgi:hypothetical protein
MDLGRWNLRHITGLTKLSNLSDRYRGFHEMLAEVLEGEREFLPAASAPTLGTSAAESFQVRDDIELVLEGFKASAKGGRALFKRDEVFFEALSEYFEAGFYFSRSEKNESEPRLRSMFLFGRSFHPQDEAGTLVPFQLPKAGPHQVLKARAWPVLHAFKLESLHKLRNAGAFLFEPKPGTLFLLVCDRPHPWQVGRIERAHALFTRAFAEPAAKRPVMKGLFR